MLGSVRNVPFLIWDETTDELVPIAGVLEQVKAFDELGYRYEFDQFQAGDHLTLAINDEYAPAAAFLGTDAVDSNPAHVTYAYNPTSFDLTAFTPATADVKITNSGAGTANAGGTLTYTVDVSNLGPDPTSGAITVIDSSTGGATPVGGSAPSGWTCSIVSGSIQCSSTATTLAVIGRASCRERVSLTV